MLENLVIALIVLAVGGVSAIAWKQPDQYRHLQNLIYAISTILFLLVMLWNMSTHMYFYFFEEFIDAEKFTQAREKLKTIQVPYLPAMAIYAATLIYTSVLLFLPKQAPKTE